MYTRSGAVRVGVEGRDKDLCNATHSVRQSEPGVWYHRANATVALPPRMAPHNTGPPIRVPWLARHRLREGENALWPELVVEQAKCFSYLPSVKAKLEVAARNGLEWDLRQPTSG